MANRHTLSVAASTLALALSCLAGAMPASAASTSSFSATVSIAAQPSNLALPSADEIKAAKKDKDSTNAMIARLEASLASSRAELQQAETTAAEAQESLLAAGEERSARTAEADKAVKQLAYAKKYLDQSRTDLGAIASDIYRNGASTSTIGILLNGEDSDDLLAKAATIDALGQQQVASVNAASEAEALVTAWQDYTDAAQRAAQDAATSYDAASSTANSTLASYQAAVAPEEQLRNELVGNLADLKDQEDAQVREELEQREQDEQEQVLQATIASEDTSDAPAVEPATILPASAEKPQEFEVDESSDDEKVKPKAEEPAAETPVTADPTEEAAEPTEEAAATTKPTEAPEATATPKPTVSETPKATETKKPAPVASETPKATETKTTAPKATKTATPKATETKKPAPKATKTATPKATASAKPKPTATKKPAPKATKTATPKPATTKKPAAETPVVSSGRSYAAAISWGLNIAADNSYYYVYGGNGPYAFDCSSFSQKAFAQSGISLPRTSTQQFRSAPQYVSLNELQPGDLVFSSSNGGASFYHVAIYIGNGQVVHARNPSVGISTTPLSWVNNLYSKAARY